MLIKNFINILELFLEFLNITVGLLSIFAKFGQKLLSIAIFMSLSIYLHTSYLKVFLEGTTREKLGPKNIIKEVFED